MRPRVLIADDHAPTLADIRSAIVADGRLDICAEASDAAEAIRLAADTDPDVCLIDLRMPGGGLGAIRQIASCHPSKPVVVLTASERDADLFAALRQGATGYLRKDMPFGDIADYLVEALNGAAAMPGPLMARVIEQFRDAGPRVRVPDEAKALDLTAREWQVLDLLAADSTTNQIADRLGIQPSSVRVNIHAVVRKLGAVDRDDAVRRYRDMARDV